MSGDDDDDDTDDPADDDNSDPHPVDDDEAVSVPAPDSEVCDTLGRADGLQLAYHPGLGIDTSQSRDKAKIINDAGVLDDDVSFIVVTNRANPYHDDARVFFSGEVGVGENFMVASAPVTAASAPQGCGGAARSQGRLPSRRAVLE